MQNGKKCRLLLVDDHVPIREALRDLVSSYNDVQLIGEAGDGKQALDLVVACRPDVNPLGLEYAGHEWH